MVQVNQSNPIIQEELSDNETITVPSGEIWRVHIISRYSCTIRLNDTQSLFIPEQSEESGFAQTRHPFILPSGTTLHPSGSSIVLNGEEISNTVDNSIVFEQGYDATFTVPSDEQWSVSLSLDRDGSVEINGIDGRMSTTRGRAGIQSNHMFKFDSGTTITFNSANGFINGWVL